MGLKYRTPLGTLREQRRKAETLEPAQEPRQTARQRKTESLGETIPTQAESTKRNHLIERLRTVLASEQGAEAADPGEYQTLQDELSRVSQHHAKSRPYTDQIQDVKIPTQNAGHSPFRVVVIQGGESSTRSREFSPIPKLTEAPVNLDAYMEAIRPTTEPVVRQLTLVTAAETKPVVVNADPASAAAALTQSNVTYSSSAKEQTLIPKSLVLSLLDEK